MQLALFWLFAVLMLGFGALTIFSRSPVNSAMSLVVCFISLAALFVTLDAFFIGIIQILVYAGAVMVLFLFIIMLLDLEAEKARRLSLSAWAGGGLVLFGFVGMLARVLASDPRLSVTKPPMATPPLDDVAAVGAMLFRNFNIPFQIIGVLLLVATVGVVLLSRRTLK
ncbi:MAG: NADH-quinone oxidoreductase subunit J [Terrimicrobiaceae bacterium]